MTILRALQQVSNRNKKNTENKVGKRKRKIINRHEIDMK